MFVIIAGLFLFIGLLVVPMIMGLSTGLFQGAETMMESTLDSAAKINDSDVRDSVTTSVQGAKDSFVTQQQIWSIFVSFIVLIIIGIIGLVMFLNGRTNVERQIG